MNDDAKAERPSPEPTPFERFEDLTRRLVKVPKHEVDELRKRLRKEG